MAVDPNSPDQIEMDEPQSLGSDCCASDVAEVDGVLICLECKHPCEEVFETEDEIWQRMKAEEEDWEEDCAMFRLEEMNSLKR